MSATFLYSLYLLGSLIVVAGLPWPLGGTYESAGCTWELYDRPSGTTDDRFRGYFDYEYLHRVATCFHKAPLHDNYAMPEMSLVANQTYALICRNSSLVSYDGFLRTMDRLKELKSRVVFIGDSIAKQQLMHLSCMIDPDMVFKKDEIQDWHEAMGNWRARETKPRGVHVKSHKVGPVFQNTQLYEKILREEIDQSRPQDVIVLNHGIHYNGAALYANLSTTKGVINERKLPLRELMRQTTEIYSEFKQKTKGKGEDGRCYILWRESSPQNFDSSNGNWGCGGLSCVAPLTPAMIEGTRLINGTCYCKGTCAPANQRNMFTSPFIQAVGMPVSPIWAPLASSPHNLHLTHKGDCTHWASNGLVLIHHVFITQLHAHWERQRLRQKEEEKDKKKDKGKGEEKEKER